MNKSKCLFMRLVLIIGLIVQCALLQASTLIDGLYYDLDTSNRTATVTYEVDGTGNYASLSANVKIPENVVYNGVTFTVTKIGENTFSNCKVLESISIPGTVLQIGQNTGVSNLPFYNCTSLKSVRFEDGASSLVLGSYYRDDRGYNGTGLFSFCPLEEVYIGRNITYIDGRYPFEKYPQYYGYSAFYNQPKLAKVTISSTVTEIPAYLFYKNASLTLTSLPKVKKIGASAFQDCSKLTTLNLGQDLQVVGNDAFNGCSNVTKLTFPDVTTTIGARAFQNCTNIKYVKSYATSPVPTGLVNFPEEVVANGTLFVPANVINNYKRSATWRKWGSIKAMTEDVFLSSLTLNQSDAHLKASETLTLVATVGPDEATNKKVDWKSDDETVASVSADGVVTAHKVGQTSIHAIANDGGGAKATCTITVDPTMVSSITLSQESLKIRKNHTAQLSAIVAPTDATNARFIWSSTNEDVAKVSEDGVISAIAPGDAVIKATSQDGSQVEASCQVKVLPVLKGDSNDDDEINVVDAVNTVNYIFNKVTGTFAFEAADVNSDDHISISDVTGTTDLIMQQVLQVKEQGAMAKGYGVSAMDDASSSDRSLDCLVLSQQDKSNIDIALDNNSNFAALQADITLPVNVNDVEVKLSGVMATTHQLSYSKLNAHTLRVVVYSLSNSTFMDGQPIFCLSSKKNLDAKNIGVTNAIGSDIEAKGYRLTSRNNEVTSIDGIGVDGTSVKVVADGLMFTGLKGTPIYVYTTSGILVKTFSLASETSKIALQAGAYLVKMNGQVVKITVK